MFHYHIAQLAILFFIYFNFQINNNNNNNNNNNYYYYYYYYYYLRQKLVIEVLLHHSFSFHLQGNFLPSRGLNPGSLHARRRLCATVWAGISVCHNIELHELGRGGGEESVEQAMGTHVTLLDLVETVLLNTGNTRSLTDCANFSAYLPQLWRRHSTYFPFPLKEGLEPGLLALHTIPCLPGHRHIGSG